MVFTPFLRVWKIPIGWEAPEGIRLHTRSFVNIQCVPSHPLFFRLIITFLGNCPPTPPLSQHQHLLLTQGKMLAQGRGRSGQLGSFPETCYDLFVVAYYFLALVIQANMKQFLSNTYQLKVEIFVFLDSVLPKCPEESSLSESNILKTPIPQY